jgi:hypothetical protein
MMTNEFNYIVQPDGTLNGMNFLTNIDMFIIGSFNSFYYHGLMDES